MTKKGFTLIELLVVISIIGLLATIVLVSVQRTRNKARIVKVRAEARQIFNAISLLEMVSDQWPGHKTPYQVQSGATDNEICSDGCPYGFSDCRAGLLCDDSGNPYPSWNGPYIKEMPRDPWGNEYFFDTDYDIDPGVGQEWIVAIGSYGPNGVGWNQYDADDILYIIIGE